MLPTAEHVPDQRELEINVMQDTVADMRVHAAGALAEALDELGQWWSATTNFPRNQFCLSMRSCRRGSGRIGKILESPESRNHPN